MTRFCKIFLAVLLAAAGLVWRNTGELSAAREELHRTRACLAAVTGELASLRASLDTADVIDRAVDGDTVELQGLGRCRLLGVNTPELWGRTDAGGWTRLDNPDQRGVAAYEFLRGLEGRLVRVQFDARRQDRYRRNLVHLYLLPDGPDLATHLLRQGWADVCAIPPNTTRYRDWKTARK